jgi:hypothetical protein
MRQRGILIAAICLAVGYVWLRGGFVGLRADGPVDTASNADSRSHT